MNKIKCVLSIKEFSVTEYDKRADYIAIFPSDISEDIVNKAIKYKFESLGEIDYKQMIIIPKAQYDLVLKPQMDVLSKYNQSLVGSEEYTRYTLTLVFNPSKQKVLMAIHHKQGMLNFIGGHIEPNEDEMKASYRELYEETGITKDDIDLKFVQIEHCITSFDNSKWHLYVTTGVLKHDVELKPEKNELCWVNCTDNDTLLNSTFGDGNCLVFLKRALLTLEKYC